MRPVAEREPGSLRELLERAPIRTVPFELWRDHPDAEAVSAESRLALRGTALATIPPATVYSTERGDEGVVAWAVQRAYNATGAGPRIAEDSVYGGFTEQAIEFWQGNGREALEAHLTVDGVFGPATSASIARRLEHNVTVALPNGLLHGLVAGESGDLAGAVNWSVPGGVDCSWVQRRVYQADYADEAAVHRAFDGAYQLDLLGRTLRDRAVGRYAYLGQPGAPTREQAWRLATLAHNYPSGADTIAARGVGGLSAYWTAPQAWVEAIGARFPDGAPARTPLDWCQHYSLGSSAHGDPGLMTRYVAAWS